MTSPTCEHCGKRPATCVGGADSGGVVRASCDACCGHNNRFGWCVDLRHIEELGKWRKRQDGTVTGPDDEFFVALRMRHTFATLLVARKIRSGYSMNDAQDEERMVFEVGDEHWQARFDLDGNFKLLVRGLGEQDRP